MSRIVVTLALMFALPTGITSAMAHDCHTVRAYVSQHGVKAAYRWARSQGYSAFEIALVRATCFRK